MRIIFILETVLPEPAGRPLRTTMTRRPAAAVLCLALLATACGATDRSPADAVRVVASFYPLAEAARHVGGQLVRVTNLTPPGVEPHDFELSPDQIEEIAAADVVLYMGGGFQPAVEEAVAGAGGSAIDVLSGMSLLGVPGSQITDPHVWLDPVRMIDIVKVVERALAQADPAAAGTFAAGARAYERRLAALDASYREILDEDVCRRRLIVTSHAAFAYLAAAYGFRQLAISGLSPEAEPDPRRLAELADLIRLNGIHTILVEELASSRAAETLARETGAMTALLNPLEGLTEDQVRAGVDYISVMTDNLSVLEAALECS